MKVCWCLPPSLQRYQGKWPIKKDSKVTNYLGILQQLGPPTSYQTEKPLVSEQVKLESRRAGTIIQLFRFWARSKHGLHLSGLNIALASRDVVLSSMVLRAQISFVLMCGSYLHVHENVLCTRITFCCCKFQIILLQSLVRTGPKALNTQKLMMEY